MNDLEKHQAENRIWAIKTLIEELQRKDNIINELKEYLEKQMKIWDKGIYLTYKEVLDKINELEERK